MRYFLFIPLFLSGETALAQNSELQEERVSYGAFAAASFNQHRGNFTQLPGVPNCGSLFTNGFGIGPDFGLYAKFPLDRHFSFSLRGLYASQNGTFNADERFPLYANGQEVMATDRHQIQASIGSIAFQPVAEYTIFQNLSLFGGMQLGYVIRNNFSQSETLEQPLGAVFTENGERARNNQSGSIPDINKFNASLVFGGSYDLTLNSSGSLKAVPQAYFTVGLTNVVKNVSWQMNSFAAGIAIEYTPPKVIPPPVIIPPPVSTPAAPPPLAATISAFGLSDDGMESPGASVLVEELYGKNMAPILPYIFLDGMESELPSRMHILNPAEATNFDQNKILSSNALESYREILNILGSRLVHVKNAPVVLTGIASDPSLMDLARKRTENIKEYLINVWAVAENRIVVRTQLSDAAKNDTDITSEEQRVEIQSNDMSLLDPLTTYDTMRTAAPPSVRMYPKLAHNFPLREWKIVASQYGQSLASFQASDSSLPKFIDWRLDSKGMPHYPGKIDFALEVKDSLGRTAEASASVRIEQLTLGKKKELRIADRTIEKYNLIVFERGSSALAPNHKRLVDQMKKEIKENSEVSIFGYTDRVGEETFNKKLSEDRASVVAKALDRERKAQIRGLGETQELYSNALPEGRFFCRTVVITIETPEKNQ